MTAKTIALIGEVSSSKSSFLNNLAGGFVSSVSLQRETFQPRLYELNKKNHRGYLTRAMSQLSHIHTENMAKRDTLSPNIENELKYMPYSLPILHDIDNINVIDFPGFNDSEDQNNIFLKALQNKSTLKLIDMIIYITDSNRAFVNASEVKLFSDIKNIVIEEEQKCHYIDLIVLVNKYDNIQDEDLQQIYDRIQQKIVISNRKIFRVSNHKMTIHALKRNNHPLYIPDFLAISEIKKIVQNANCTVAKYIQSTPDSHYTILTSHDMQFGDLADNLVAGQMPKLIGDWDDLIGYLKDFPVAHTKDILNMMEHKMNCWVQECEPLNAEYKKFSIHESLECQLLETRIQYKKFSINESLECQLLETMIHYHRILHKYDPSHTIFNKYIMILIESVLNTDQKIRPIILENIFQYRTNSVLREKIITAVKKSDIIATETLIIIFDLMVHSKHNLNIHLTDIFWINKIFTQPVTYAPTFKFYSRSGQRWVRGYKTHNVVINHPSWFITSLINNNAIPKNFQQQILLTVLPIDTLKMLLSQNMIDENILSTIDPDLPIKFRYLVQINPDNRKILEDHLFGSNTRTISNRVRAYKYWINIANK